MTIRRSRSRRAATALAAVLALAALAAARAPAATADSTATANGLTVKAGEYVYKLIGAPKSGWAQVTFENDGVEYHMMDVISLRKGVTARQVKAALATGDAALGKLLGKGQVTGTPSVLAPDERTTTLARFAPGHYAMLCRVLAPDGASHALHGMVAVFDVSTDRSSFAPPRDGVVDVTLSDEALTLPTAGLPAHAWARITNATSVTRSVTIGRYLVSGATYDQADDYFTKLFGTGTAPAGNPPVAITAGVANIAAGGVAYLQLDLDRGDYVAVSSNGEVDNDPNQLHTDFSEP